MVPEWLIYTGAAGYLIGLAWQINRIERAVTRAIDLLMTLDEVRERSISRVGDLGARGEPELAEQFGVDERLHLERTPVTRQ
jgi:hypothetical protein